MLREQRHSAECLVTPVAGILLDVAVGLQVGPQVAPVGEGTVAVRTGEWLLAGMRPDVTLKQPRSGERFAALLALARQRVRPDVHLERAHAEVELLAVLAREGLLRLALSGRAVELLMLRQAGIRRVRLVAVGARVSGRSRRGRRAGRRGRGGIRTVLIEFRVYDRTGGSATSGRSAALAAGRREILRRDGRR